MMTIDMPPVPPAVIEYAESGGWVYGVRYRGEWNGYTVYLPLSRQTPQKQCNGLPQFILVDKDGNMRFANSEEQMEVWPATSRNINF